MNSKVVVAVLLVAAVAVAVIATLTFAPEREVPYPTGDTEGLIAAVADLRQEVERLSKRVDDMENRVVVSGGGDPASGSAKPRPGAEPGPAGKPPGSDAGRKAKKAVELEAAGLAAMKTGELLLLGTLRPGEKRSADTRVRYLEELLLRDIETELRVQALFQLGYAHRGQGKHDRADEAFRDAKRLQPDGRNAANAEYQLAWSCRMRKDYRGAISHYEAAVSHRAVRDAYRVSLGFQTADCYLYLDEPRAATGVLESLVTKYAGSTDASVKGEIARAKAKLKKIEAEATGD